VAPPYYGAVAGDDQFFGVEGPFVAPGKDSYMIAA
jgi:hypothetical protein